ncbi:MAG: peptidase M23 [Cycloclasticus sp.]|nr:MAG: peptidase M23 [Cycloclasticus sp.]
MIKLTDKQNIYLTPLLLLLLAVLVSCSSTQQYAPVYSDKNWAKNTSATKHVVRLGDTLYSIAWQTGKDYKKIATWNNISWPYTIYKGQTLSLVARKSAYKVTQKKAVKRQKTVKKQKITKKTSNISKKEVQLTWQWPIKVKKLEKGLVNTGLILVGSTGELVRSSERGKVVYAGNGLKGYGNLLIIKHDEEFLTAYGYNKRLLVKEGSVVKKGQAIAEIGIDKKKRRVLFFEIRQHGKALSVTKYMPK